MLEPLRRALLHYYIALTMSAGMATPLAWVPSLDGPPPIVRRSRQPGAGQLDPCEIVSDGTVSAVVTRPLAPDLSVPPSMILDN